MDKKTFREIMWKKFGDNFDHIIKNKIFREIVLSLPDFVASKIISELGFLNCVLTRNFNSKVANGNHQPNHYVNDF